MIHIQQQDNRFGNINIRQDRKLQVNEQSYFLGIPKE